MKAKKKVSLISRESDNITLDFQLLKEELDNRGHDVRILTKQFKKRLSIESFGYIIEIIKQISAIKTSDVVVLDTYCIPVSILKHRKETKVVQMWHALSAIKQFGWQTVGKEDGTSKLIAKVMKMHKGYDSVLCSSDITADFFCKAFHINTDKIIKIGLPRIDYILRDDFAIAKEIKETYSGINNKKKTILYAPTFRGKDEVDVKGFITAIDFNKYNLIVKLHPLDKVHFSQIQEGVVFDEKYNVYDLLKAADIVVSDYSSFVVEASLSKKPLYLYTYDSDKYKQTTGLNVDFENEPIGKYAFADAKELTKAIEQEYDYAALKQFREKYIDVDTTNCTKQIADYIEELL